VTALVNASTGTIAASYYYNAFGVVLESTGTANNSILYAGYQYDKETGLYYLNARMYDPATARFLQEDTYTGDRTDPLSLNLYTYCHNEPLMYSDPTGHREVTERDEKNMGGGAPPSSEKIKEDKKKEQEQGESSFFDGVKNLFDQIIGEPLSEISDFVQENKDAIIIATVSVVSIVAGVAIMPFIPALGAALVGGGASTAITLIMDFVEDGKYNKSASEYIAAGVSGFLFGAAGAVVNGAAISSVAKIAGMAAFGGVTDALKQEIAYGEINMTEVMGAALFSGVGEYIYLGITGSLTRNIPGLNSAPGDSKAAYADESIGIGDNARTPEDAGISASDARRIQNAADRTGQEINVVGSRASGTASEVSDWDYVMSGNSAQRHSAAGSIPIGTSGGSINSLGIETGIDIYTNNPNSPSYVPLDPTLPYVPFRPQR